MVRPNPTTITRYIKLIAKDIIHTLNDPRFEFKLSTDVFYHYLTCDYFRIQCIFNAYSPFILDSIIDESLNHEVIKAAFIQHYKIYRNYLIQKQINYKAIKQQ